MHSFVLSADSSKCAKCKRPEVDHTQYATCESCPTVGPCEIYSPEPNISLLLCPNCIRNEEKARESPEAQAQRLKMIADRSKRDDTPTTGVKLPQSALDLINRAKAIDDSVQVRTDIFNLQTTSIIELKSSIDADDSIKDKSYQLAVVLTERLNHFKKVIFELNEEMVNKATEQRAVQTYLNELANRLRAEQRDELKLRDINYQPDPVKIVKPRTSSALAPKKIDKSEVKRWAKEIGMPEQMIQMTCISKNMSPEQAARHIQQTMAGM